MYRKKQETIDVNIPVPMMLKDSTQATSLTVSSFTTAIIDPDGTALSNYTEPTITNPGSNGIYFCNFDSAANSLAFTSENSGNPYSFTLDHPETDVEPFGPIPVWVSDRLQGELATTTEVGSNLTAITSLQTSTIETNDLTGFSEGRTRIEASDTFQFTKNFFTAPDSVQVSIYWSPTDESSATLITSLASGVQSGSSANFYYFHTDSGSHFTTVDSSGNHFIEWMGQRATGDDISREYFEIIKTD